MKVERCQRSIKNMRAKRQASTSSSDTVSPVSPSPSTGEPKRFLLQKRQTSSSSSDDAQAHRPPKLFFARKASGEPPASPSIKSPRSPGIKGLCRRRSQEEPPTPTPTHPQPQSMSTSTSTLVEVALAQVAPRSPSPRRQTSIDTLVEEPSEMPSAETAAQAQKRDGLTDQQLMLIIVVLAVSQCLLIARLRAAAM